MAKGSPPSFTIPAPPSKKGSKSLTEQGVFKSFINAHPALKPYAGQIWAWTQGSGAYGGITASQLAAAIWTYTKGKPTPQALQAMAGNPTGQNANGIPWNTASNRSSSGFWVQAIAWRYSGTASTSNPDQGYTQAFGGTASPSGLLPKGYVGTPPPTQGQKGAGSVTQSQVTGGIKDPWVIAGGKGGVTFVNSASAPRNALSFFGMPMTRSQFLQYQNSLDNTYLAYTGKRATAAQVAMTIQHGWSTTQVQIQLSQTPAFKNSPVWKQNAPSYTAAWQRIYGPNSKPDPKALQYAIVHNLDTTAFEQSLRSRKDYTKSLEYKKNAADLSGTYTSIYGVPDANGNKVINQAAKNGYSQQQFANYLRKQPQYTSSDEFKSNAMNWAKSMGLLSQGPLEANSALSTMTTPGPTAPVVPNAQGAPVPAPGTGNPIPPTGQSGYAQGSNANIH